MGFLDLALWALAPVELLAWAVGVAYFVHSACVEAGSSAGQAVVAGVGGVVCCALLLGFPLLVFGTIVPSRAAWRLACALGRYVVSTMPDGGRRYWIRRAAKKLHPLFTGQGWKLTKGGELKGALVGVYVDGLGAEYHVGLTWEGADQVKVRVLALCEALPPSESKVFEQAAVMSVGEVKEQVRDWLLVAAFNVLIARTGD